LDIDVPPEIPQLRWDIAPGHHEGAESLLDTEPHKGILRLQIQDVVFIDEWRNNQQRKFVDLGGRRCILDQLHYFVLEDYRAGCNGQIAADLEGLLVRHGNPSPGHVAGQQIHALHEAFSAGLRCQFDDFRIGRRIIIRRHGVRQLAQLKLQPALGPWFEICELSELNKVARIELVSLLYVPEKGQLPLGCVETLVAVGGSRSIGAWFAQSAPKRQVLAIKRLLERTQRFELPLICGGKDTQKSRDVASAGTRQAAKEILEHARMGTGNFSKMVAR